MTQIIEENQTINPQPERRKPPVKYRKKGERRASLMIVKPVSSSDIYLWTISILIMGVVITTLLLVSLI